jgi:hypothetical protein
MNIDCLAQYASIAKDTVLTIAAVVGAYVALRGLSTWNRQLKGGVEYDLTRRILKCTYRLREAIKDVRSPAIWGHEMPPPPEAEASKMSLEQLRYYGLANAYQKRWDKVADVRTDLQTEMLEAEAIWGRIVYETFEPVFKLEQELFSAIYVYLLTLNPNESDRFGAPYQEIMTKQRDILYHHLSSENPDEYTKDLTCAIEAIESFLKPHLRK